MVYLIGISMFPSDGHDVSTLFAKAHQSLSLVKGKGESAFAYGDTTRSQKQFLAKELKFLSLYSLPADALRIRYEPLFDLQTNQLLGAEAVVTWKADQGWLPLHVFRNDLEASGDVSQTERAVLEHLCFEVCRSTVPNISFDISPHHFLQADFIAFVKKTLSETGLNPTRLTLEVDSFVVRLNSKLCANVIEKLTEIGVRVVLDNFGSHFVPYHDLQKLQISGVKLERSLVHKAAEQGLGTTMIMLAMLIEQAGEQGFTVGAVDVRNGDDLRVVKHLKCSVGQGAFWGNPSATMPKLIDNTGVANDYKAN
ncbi:MAG: EAL domain-containing protein [Trueperaceae bacterium]